MGGVLRRRRAAGVPAVVRVARAVLPGVERNGRRLGDGQSRGRRFESHRARREGPHDGGDESTREYYTRGDEFHVHRGLRQAQNSTLGDGRGVRVERGVLVRVRATREHHRAVRGPVGRSLRHPHRVCAVGESGVDTGADAGGDENLGSAATDGNGADAGDEDGDRLDAVLAVVPHPSRGGVRERRRWRGRRTHEEPDVVRVALSPPGGAHRRGAVFIPSRLELCHRGGAVGTHRSVHGCVVPVVLRG